jgi:hypothetical protein
MTSWIDHLVSRGVGKLTNLNAFVEKLLKDAFGLYSNLDDSAQVGVDGREAVPQPNLRIESEFPKLVTSPKLVTGTLLLTLVILCLL